jgi:hypothetical protein
MTKVHEHDVERRDDTEVVTTDRAYEKFGGTNAGAGFFGWLVAVAVTVLLTGIIGAIAAAVGDANNVTQSEAQRAAGTVGLVSAIVLIAVLMIGYYAGGYVAGRMSRFDGARQGLWVWVIGLVVTVVAVAAGWAFGAKYNVLDRVSLPRIPIPHDQLTTGGVLTGILVLAGTLIAAMAGGSVGRHYHARVDRYVDRTIER